jgi:hypothetical protein
MDGPRWIVSAEADCSSHRTPAAAALAGLAARLHPSLRICGAGMVDRSDSQVGAGRQSDRNDEHQSDSTHLSYVAREAERVTAQGRDSRGRDTGSLPAIPPVVAPGSMSSRALACATFLFRRAMGRRDEKRQRLLPTWIASIALAI